MLQVHVWPVGVHSRFKRITTGLPPVAEELPLPPGGRTKWLVVEPLKRLGGTALVLLFGALASRGSSVAYLAAIELLKRRAPN